MSLLSLTLVVMNGIGGGAMVVVGVVVMVVIILGGSIGPGDVDAMQALN